MASRDERPHGPISGRGFEQGDHVCVAYRTADEQLSIAVHFIAEGLRRDEQCLYAAATPAALAAFRDALRAREGLDAGAAERAGRLLLLTKERAHLHGGRFDAERMLGMLNAQVEAALNAGFIGLRTCGDMSWLLDDAPGADQVVEYEALLAQFFGTVRATGMCQYDITRLPGGLLDHALATHPSVVIEGRHVSNPFFQSPPEDGGAARKLEALRRADA